jgi:hypothetical protein
VRLAAAQPTDRVASPVPETTGVPDQHRPATTLDVGQATSTTPAQSSI